jgi:hypothetical protein
MKQEVTISTNDYRLLKGGQKHIVVSNNGNTIRLTEHPLNVLEVVADYTTISGNLHRRSFRFTMTDTMDVYVEKSKEAINRKWAIIYPIEDNLAIILNHIYRG